VSIDSSEIEPSSASGRPPDAREAHYAPRNPDEKALSATRGAGRAE